MATTDRDDFDPFAVKDEMFGAGAVDDPYPRFAELRRQCPVVAGSLSSQFGVAGPDSLLFAEDDQYSVFPFSGRVAGRDVELSGCPIEAGKVVNLAVGAANRDPSRWDRPDEFDIFRSPRPHLGFGAGPHLCLGIHLARAELRIATESLLDRLEGLRLDPDAPPPRLTGLGMRTAPSLPVVFTPEAG